MKQYTRENVERLKPGESVHLIIDEVQVNVDDSLWDYLPKGFSQIVMIGAGVRDEAGYTLRFRIKADPDFIVISSEDLEESVKLFLNLTKCSDEHAVRNTFSWV